MPDNTSGDWSADSARLSVAAEWDAGYMGCGEVIILLRKKMQKLQPGEIFKLISYDLGAHEDLPAWCRMTGRRLVSAQHPSYWIEQKGV